MADRPTAASPAAPVAAHPTADGLSPEKRRLLEQRLRARALASRPAIPSRGDSPPSGISDAQLRLLLLNESHERLIAYNVAQAVRIDGPLDLDALRRALDDLYARHVILRSQFSLRDGRGHVEIAPPGACDVEVSPVAEVNAFVHAVVTEPFDLSGGRLLRARIGVLGPQQHVLVMSTHHIVSDAVSKRVLTNELNDLYVAHRDGVANSLRPQTIDYYDYAEWLSKRATDDVEWWRTYLTGAPEETELPVDRSRPSAADFSGAKHVHRLDADLVARAGAFANQRRATMFMVLLATYAGVLQRHSNQDDLVVGSPTSGRHREEFADVVGLFLNMLPLRIDTSGDPSFAELVGRVRKSAAEAYRHQDVPFDQIVQAVRPPRVLGRNPLFQSLFTVKDGADATPVLDGLHITPIGFEGGWTKFDLSVICNPVGDSMAVLWQYATSLFDAVTIERLGGQFERLLRAGVQHPDVALSALGLADAADVAMLQTWNATDADVDLPLVHEMIAEQAARTPDASAVGDQTGWITFGDLDERANRLAQHLVSLGVGPDQRVAIFLERSIDLEVALLAVLKAGGAYVPLDTGYPAERLEFMVEDSDAVVLITTSHLANEAPKSANNVVIDQLDLADRPATVPNTGVTADHLAYVLYTSGTTGRPKGVQMEHRSVANQIAWLRTHLGVSSADSVLQKTPISFDVAGWEVLLAPASGARLFMAKPGGHLDPDYLIDLIRHQRITVVNFVPSMLSIFLGRDAARGCASLRMLITAGEALTDEVAEACFDTLPDTQLWNIYGPTETIGITFELCRRGRSVTIGHPMDNCQAYVLDSAYGHQPVGAPGELYLGGAQVARGYLNRPELTEERFVDTPHGRLYRTGDRAVWQADGRLQYLGRLDDQVKLRGFRIELGEIESVLSGHRDVQAACAAVGNTAGGQPVLTSFITLRPDVATLTAPDASPVQQIRHWVDKWNEIYRGPDPIDRTFDTRGWTNPVTGRPIPEPEMREWVGATVDRISALHPASVLEVGAGTGLLLWRLAPRVQRYDATDSSPVAIDRLYEDRRHHDNVTARLQAAHELAPLRPGQLYDCVVFNSVVQYFPNGDYLRSALERALDALAPDGSVYVGDVRDLRLYDAFALETAGALTPSGSVVELRTQVDDRRALEDELIVDPGFFRGLPGVEHVQVLPKRGHVATEMNRYRFDVVLHTRPDVARVVDEWLDWSEFGSVDNLTDALRNRDGAEFGVLGIPNRRVAAASAALAELDAGRLSPATYSDVGVDPDQLHAIAAAAGYRVELSGARRGDAIDAVFTHDGRPVAFPAPDEPTVTVNDPRSAWARAQRRAAVIDELTASLRQRLPEHMVPSSIRVLDSLPLTPSGKLDRRMLGELTAPIRRAGRIEARTDTERRLMRVWQSGLGLDHPISIEDSFFDLGGSSLLALSLFPRIEREFGVKLALAMLFENVTVASLAAVIDGERNRSETWDLIVPIRSTGHKRPLFFMPEQRGDVLAYRQLVSSLDQDRPVYGIQCVGLDGRETPRTSIEAVATDCVEALRRVQPHGPYLLAGYCFGGVVAFEVGAQLVAAGEEVEFLGIIDATPFGRGGGMMAHLKPTLARRLTWRSKDELRRKIAFVRTEIRWRINAAITRMCVSLGLRTPRSFVDVHAANRIGTKNYVAPDAPLAVTFFRASDGTIEADELRRQRWEMVAQKGVEMRLVSGYLINHAQIVRSAFAPRLASLMDECMANLD